MSEESIFTHFQRESAAAVRKNTSWCKTDKDENFILKTGTFVCTFDEYACFVFPWQYLSD